MLPSYLQLLCLILDLYLIVKLQQPATLADSGFDRWMARNYLIFSLVRSLIRAYAQWFCSLESWRLVYWWGELIGCIVTIVLIAGVTERLLQEHVNTQLFYTMMGLGLTILALWRLPYPLTLMSLWQTCNIAKLVSMFLMLMAMTLGKGWDPLSRWIGAGVVLNLVVQWVGGWVELHHGSDLRITLISQLGFLNLQLCWLVGVTRVNNQPTIQLLRGI